MYLFNIKYSLIGLIIGLVAICSSYTMDHYSASAIVNLPANSLTQDDVTKLQELITAWQTFYKDNSYRNLMANIKPFVDGCGIIHDLKETSILHTRHHETACIVDMTKVVGATEPHFHRNTTEVYFILQGTGTIVIGEQEYQVKPGDVVYIPINLGHYTVPTKDLVLSVVNIPYFDKGDIFDLRTADDRTRRAVKYDHARYLHYTHQFNDESRRIYTERYPTIFKTFLQHTNEKEIERAYIARVSKLVSNTVPDWLQKQPIIYDIGCGDGYLSSLVLKDLQTLIPKDLRYIGIDPQKELLEKATQAIKGMSWVKPLFRAQKFEQVIPDPISYPVADMILMVQSCYYMQDISSCIGIMKNLMSPHGCALLIHVHDSALHQFKEQHKEIIESKSVDLLDIIETALTKAGLHYAILELPVAVKFPKISDETWQHLLAVPYAHYNVDYSAFGDDFICMKNLFEFFFEHPLEAFPTEQKKVLLEGLRKILMDTKYAITIYHRMHIVTANALPEKIFSELRKSTSPLRSKL